MRTAYYLMPGPRSRVTGQATYGMSNLRPETTGLPFIVFISQQDSAKHAARVKWSPAPKVQSKKMGSYALDPFEHKTGPKLENKQERLLKNWIDLNIETLQKYWNGEIEYTEEVLEQIKSL